MGIFSGLRNAFTGRSSSAQEQEMQEVHREATKTKVVFIDMIRRRPLPPSKLSWLQESHRNMLQRSVQLSTKEVGECRQQLSNAQAIDSAVRTHATRALNQAPAEARRRAEQEKQELLERIEQTKRTYNELVHNVNAVENDLRSIDDARRKIAQELATLRKRQADEEAKLARFGNRKVTDLFRSKVGGAEGRRAVIEAVQNGESFSKIEMLTVGNHIKALEEMKEKLDKISTQINGRRGNSLAVSGISKQDQLQLREMRHQLLGQMQEQLVELQKLQSDLYNISPEKYKGNIELEFSTGTQQEAEMLVNLIIQQIQNHNTSIAEMMELLEEMRIDVAAVNPALAERLERTLADMERRHKRFERSVAA